MTSSKLAKSLFFVFYLFSSFDGVSAKGSLEFYNYDAQGSLIDVYGEDLQHKLSQRWGAWGQRFILHKKSTREAPWQADKVTTIYPAARDAFLPLLDLPVYLGYLGHVGVFNDGMIAKPSGLYSPKMFGHINSGYSRSNFGKSPLNRLHRGLAKKYTPNPRSAAVAYGAEAAAAALWVAVCVATEGGCIAFFNSALASQLVEAGFGWESASLLSAAYGQALAGVGYVSSGVSCPIAWWFAELDESTSNTMRGVCHGSITAFHSGARMALSARFAGKLGEGQLRRWTTLRDPTNIDQIKYGLSFTAINAASSIATMRNSRSSWDEMPRGFAVTATIISGLQAVSDMYAMRWFESMPLFSSTYEGVELSAAEAHKISYGKMDGLSARGMRLTMGTAGRVTADVTKLHKWGSRVAETGFIAVLDLAHKLNAERGGMSQKNNNCSLLQTLVYQGTRVGIANLGPRESFGGYKHMFGKGLTIGRAVAGLNIRGLSVTQLCGEYRGWG